MICLFFLAPGAITRMENVRYLSHFTTQSNRAFWLKGIFLKAKSIRDVERSGYSIHTLLIFYFLFFFKLIMLPKGSSKHCAADKFSLFSKAFLSISNAPLWQVEGKHTKFCGRAVFPALRCQKTSKRSFFTSKKIDRFGYVTQPDQASVPCVYEYK